MNFKVGDKVKAIDNFHSYASKESQFVGIIRKVLNSFKMVVETISDTNKARIGMWHRVDVTHFELVGQTEFKLQEPKKKVQIIKVEHGKDRKQYEFIGINETDYCTIINEGDFVECDTKHGSSYGRCVGRIIKELTEEEIKQYKECWRA